MSLVKEYLKVNLRQVGSYVIVFYYFLKCFVMCFCGRSWGWSGFKDRKFFYLFISFFYYLQQDGVLNKDVQQVGLNKRVNN